MDVVIIGGSAAGLKAACRIARLKPDADVKVITSDKHFGYSACGLPYFLSGEVDSIDSLLRTPNGTIKDEWYFREVKGVQVLSQHDALKIDRASRTVQCKNLKNGKEIDLPYDKLVIATGAVPLRPAIPGSDLPGVMNFTSLKDAINLRRDLEQGKINSVVILGGGFIGMELCEAFRSLWGVEVDVFETQPHVLTGLLDVELIRLVEAELERNGVKLHLGCRCREIYKDSETYCVFDQTGEMVEADGIILTTGIRPNVELAQDAGIDLGVTGGIKVNDHLVTSDPEIFAAGDCVELKSVIDGNVGLWSLGSLANRMGRIVGDNICDGDVRFGAVTGAIVLKVFDLTIGSVGFIDAECEEKGFDIAHSWGTFHDRLHYYPGSTPVQTRLTYDRVNGSILGFQATSSGNLLHVIDKASMLIKNHSKIDDLHNLEHAYAPPFAQTLDPLHTLAFIAENSLSSGVKLVSPIDLNNLPLSTLMLDVRNSDEIAGFPLDFGHKLYLHIPVEELRARINEVPDGNPVVAICQMGSRSWDAAMMLRRAGFSDVGILAGGVLFQPNLKIQ